MLKELREDVFFNKKSNLLEFTRSYVRQFFKNRNALFSSFAMSRNYKLITSNPLITSSKSLRMIMIDNSNKDRTLLYVI